MNEGLDDPQWTATGVAYVLLHKKGVLCICYTVLTNIIFFYTLTQTC